MYCNKALQSSIRNLRFGTCLLTWRKSRMSLPFSFELNETVSGLTTFAVEDISVIKPNSRRSETASEIKSGWFLVNLLLPKRMLGGVNSKGMKYPCLITFKIHSDALKSIQNLICACKFPLTVGVALTYSYSSKFCPKNSRKSLSHLSAITPSMSSSILHATGQFPGKIPGNICEMRGKIMGGRRYGVEKNLWLCYWNFRRSWISQGELDIHATNAWNSAEMTGSPQLVMLTDLRQLVGKSEEVSLSCKATRVRRIPETSALRAVHITFVFVLPAIAKRLLLCRTDFLNVVGV